jgi:hypothetical protein
MPRQERPPHEDLSSCLVADELSSDRGLAAWTPVEQEKHGFVRYVRNAQ